MIKQLGYRGYISSRPSANGRVPQHVQNLVIRDYCTTNNLHYLLSAVEYAMPNSYIMLEQVLREAVNNQGLVMYSMFQLPQNTVERNRIYNLVIDNQVELHMAVESLVIKDKDSVQRVEDIWLVHQTLYGAKNHSTRNHNSAKQNLMNFFGFGSYGRN